MSGATPAAPSTSGNVLPACVAALRCRHTRVPQTRAAPTRPASAHAGRHPQHGVSRARRAPRTRLRGRRRACAATDRAHLPVPALAASADAGSRAEQSRRRHARARLASSPSPASAPPAGAGRAPESPTALRGSPHGRPTSRESAHNAQTSPARCRGVPRRSCGAPSSRDPPIDDECQPTGHAATRSVSSEGCAAGTNACR